MQPRLELFSTTDTKHFLDRLRRLVMDEAATARFAIERIWSKPIPTRVAEGHAIEGVRIQSLDREGYLHLTCDRNLSRFREGDILCLNRGDPFQMPQCMVTLELEETPELTVSVNPREGNIAELLREPIGWILDEGFLDLSQYLIDALDEAGDTAIGRKRILPLLMGDLRPTMDVPHYERGLALGESFALNWSQTEALAQAYATNFVYLIQGPPGTGKTRVLAHLAQLFADEGERVLVTAATHRAINNALNKVAEVAPEIPAIKIGQAIQANDLKVPNYENFQSSPMAEMDKGYVIGATPFALRTNRLNGVEFETVIFDEASQITLPLAIMGMLRAKRFIFIGDHKQLPPVFQANHQSNALLKTSVFGFLAGRGFDTMLSETYRLNAELVEWPGLTFYNGELTPVPEIVARRITYTNPSARLEDILDPQHVKVFLDLAHRNNTTHSQMEASVIVDLVLTLLESGVTANEIGIVTPYRAQAREIRHLLQRALPDAVTRRAIVIDTVERLQGQERDVILLSLTTSNPVFAADLAEFFFQPERLNVAVTRPRKKLIIVGSRHVLNAQPDDEELAQGVELLRDLLKSCTYRTFDSTSAPWQP